MKYFLFSFLCISMISCGGDDDSSDESPEICTTVVVPSFSIIVVDTDGNLIDGATVTVIENSFSAVLVESSTGVYTGPDERVGTYLITIMKEGFQDITVTNPQIVSLTEDMCHVDTIEMTYILQSI